MSDKLRQIETILADIEAFDRASGGAFRQAEDRESYDLVCRIERKMQGRVKSDNLRETG